jgi:hypothetical protein
MQLWMHLGSVMQQPSVYAIHDVYMTIMSIPWYGCLMVASNQGSDEGGKMHARCMQAYMAWQHVCYTPSTHTRVRQSSLRAYRAYELLQSSAGSVHEQFRY